MVPCWLRSPKIALWFEPDVATPTLAWFCPPISPRRRPLQVPLLPMMTSPGLLMPDFNVALPAADLVEFLAEKICDEAHHVAMRSEATSSNADTICPGGTLSV